MTTIRGRNASDIFNRSGDDLGESIHQWLTLDTWSYQAAMFLIAGVVPEQVYGEGFGYSKIEGPLLSNDDGEKDRIADNIENLTRLWLSNPDHPEKANPQFFISWAEGKDIDIYWLKGAREFGYLLPVNPTPEKEVKPLATTERNQLLKIILGMAVDSYGYDPAANKNDATKQIVDDLSKIDIKIDAGTVLKYLKEAARTVSFTMPNKK
jgi:hypothetical protein